jgi:hypothetical protein
MKAILILLLLAAPTFAQEKKSIFREPSFWVNVGGTSADIITSAIVIDGKRIKEGNPWLSTPQGKVAWSRALPVKVALILAPAIVYRWNPSFARKWMWISGGIQAGAAVYTVSLRF